MKLSTRSRYGTRVLAELALHGDKVVSLGEITAKHQLSRAYIEHSLAPLVKAGIIQTYRGIGGGICLGRPADQVKLGEVVSLLEGSDLVLDCINQPEICTRSAHCLTRGIWEKMALSILVVLNSITLQDLVDQFKLDDSCNRKSYPGDEKEEEDVSEDIERRCPGCT